MGNQQKNNDETNQLSTSEIILITSLCISGTILVIAIIAFVLVRFKHWHQQKAETGIHNFDVSLVDH